ncbi:ankyrin repeat domain-containing protein 10-like [Argiope bruennichi]|uniref:Ankyrin repeat domain-containing protein 10 n=1 Tax=Argiope bruennichi TaxID=94029 RepID=A0A8T0FGU7_ARGBR|nr:ankyrin repeat domain-containing protein 10-like [Argiope bruennichi]KAF8789622.1 Ankyrin repeat domain-containing protein 10 [Argiope bruennichi]
MFHNGLEAGAIDEAVFCNNYPVHKNCRDGNVQSVSSILSSQPMLAVSEDSFRNWTPIHWAAYSGHLECVRHVASVEPRTIHIQSSKTFQTPLHTASEGGHPFVVLWLLQAGTNPKVKDIFGETALHKAARIGNAECVSLLMEVADNIGSQNLSGQTASALALVSGFPDLARFISQREEACLNAFQSRQILPIPRMSRKRMRDAVCDDDVCKRRRPDEVISSDVSDAMDSMTTSRYEHDNLCCVDFGYRNILYEVMLSEYHGC